MTVFYIVLAFVGDRWGFPGNLRELWGQSKTILSGIPDDMFAIVLILLGSMRDPSGSNVAPSWLTSGQFSWPKTL